MKIDLRKAVWCSAMLAASMFGVGCAGAPPGGDTQGTSNGTSGPADPGNGGDGSTAKIHGTLLHSITRGADHVIEFWDFDHGTTAVHESFLVGDKAVLDVQQPMALADLYRLVAPGTDVPKTVLDADARAAAYVAAQPTPATSAPLSDGHTHVLHSTVGGPPKGTVAPDAVTCSGDLSGDGWSGTWFLNNYCNAGAYRWCQANWDWGSYDVQGSWFTWRQLEGDFNNTGHTHGEHEYKPCSWPWACGVAIATDWDYDVLPRHVEVWTYGNSNGYTRRANGSSQCGHCSFAALSN